MVLYPVNGHNLHHVDMYILEHSQDTLNFDIEQNRLFSVIWCLIWNITLLYHYGSLIFCQNGDDGDGDVLVNNDNDNDDDNDDHRHHQQDTMYVLACDD